MSGHVYWALMQRFVLEKDENVTKMMMTLSCLIVNN